MKLALGVRLTGYAIGLALLVCTIVFALTRRPAVLAAAAVLAVIMFGFMSWASLYRFRQIEKQRGEGR